MRFLFLWFKTSARKKPSSAFLTSLFSHPLSESTVVGVVLRNASIPVLLLVRHQLFKFRLPFWTVADAPLEANLVQEILALLGERSWLARHVFVILLALTGDLWKQARTNTSR